MSNTLVLLRPRDEVSAFVKAAVDKFKVMQGIDLTILPAKSLNAVANNIENGSIAIIFAEELLQLPEVNLLATCLRKAKRKPFIITHDRNFESLTAKISVDLVGVTANEFNEGFIFNCIRNLLTPTGRKLDRRYIQGIVTSVVDVIQQNTQCEIIPQPVTEIRAAETPEEVSSVLAFSGDGFLGSITITTGKALLTHFTTKMLYCEESDVNEEMMIDLLSELSNQIVGVVRNGLSEFGYRLSSSMQAVVLGPEFLNATIATGRYYTIPFRFNEQKFDISLCYNTYQTSIRELEDEGMQAYQKNLLDIRLVDTAATVALDILSTSIGDTLEKGLVRIQKSSSYNGTAVQVFHAASWQGKVILALDVPKMASDHILTRALGLAPEAIDDAAINEYFGEILNQIASEFLKQVKPFGYKFQKVYLGNFAGKELRYNLKNKGLYFRQKYFTENYEIDVIFGSDSSFGSSYFNVWPYFQTSDGFTA